MKLMILITFLVAGAVAEEPEASSALLVSSRIPTNTNSSNRRGGVSYSTNVIHRNPDHPGKDAASSIDFQFNIGDFDQKATNSPQATTNEQFQAYTTSAPLQQSYHRHVGAKYSSHSLAPVEEKRVEDFSQNSEAIDSDQQQQSEYSSSAIQQQDEAYYQSNYQSTSPHSNNQENNYHTYYKPNSYSQPILSETTHKFEIQHPSPQYKPFASNQKPASTARPRNKHSKHHQSHAHQPHDSGLPESQNIKQAQALAIVQAIYPKYEHSAKASKTVSPYEHSSTGQTQSFNVGYSMKFGNEGNKKQLKFSPTHHEGDIITGNHKEEVNKPSHLSFGHDKNRYVPGAHTQQKQLVFLENYQNNKASVKQPSNLLWKNLSPSVEIYKSKDINIPEKNAPNFDHEKAMGKSEGFDYSNALEYLLEAQKAMIAHSAHRQPSTPQHGGLEVEQLVQLQTNPHSNIPQKLSSPPKLQLDTSLLREPFLTTHKKHPQSSQASKLPIHFDTRLVQDISNEYQTLIREGSSPHPTSDPQSAQGSVSQIRNLLAEQSQQQNTYRLVPTTAQVEQSLHSPLTQSTQPTIYLIHPTGNTDAAMTFKYPQKGLLGGNMNVVNVVPKNHMEHVSASDIVYVPVSNSNKHNSPSRIKHIKMYKVKEQVNDHVPPQQVKFKVFGKPGNMFMRSHYDKGRIERPIRVQQVSQKRFVREYPDIEMDLRPPPRTPFHASNYQRN